MSVLHSLYSTPGNSLYCRVHRKISQHTQFFQYLFQYHIPS